MRRRARIDANQPDLVKLIRSLGASWEHTHQIAGALDGIIGYRGIDVRAEIKDPAQDLNKRALTPDEQKTIDEWKGRKPVILETEEDVFRVLKQIKQEVEA